VRYCAERQQLVLREIQEIKDALQEFEAGGSIWSNAWSGSISSIARQHVAEFN
jgi:hypothetical protein